MHGYAIFYPTLGQNTNYEWLKTQNLLTRASALYRRSVLFSFLPYPSKVREAESLTDYAFTRDTCLSETRLRH